MSTFSLSAEETSALVSPRPAKNLKAEIDAELIEACRDTVSLPFEPGEHRRIAIKVVDDRGIESLMMMGVED